MKGRIGGFGGNDNRVGYYCGFFDMGDKCVEKVGKWEKARVSRGWR